MLLLGLAVIAGLGGCNVSRLIPDGQYLLESVEGGEKWRHFQTVQLWDRQL